MVSKNELKLYRSLQSRHGRNKSNLCICEGQKHCKELFNSNPKLILRAFYSGILPEMEFFKNFNLEEISSEQMRNISPSKSSKGMIFIARRPEFANFAEASKTHFAIVLDRIQDPGNLGTIIRTAKAAGVNQLFLSNDCADPFADKVIRAGTALQFSTIFIEYERLDSILKEFKNIGYKNLFLSSVNEGENIFKINDLFENSVLVFGNEGSGLPENIDGRKFTIPMPGAIDSLNVAQAFTITIFESVRRSLKYP